MERLVRQATARVTLLMLIAAIVAPAAAAQSDIRPARVTAAVSGQQAEAWRAARLTLPTLVIDASAASGAPRSILVYAGSGGGSLRAQTLSERPVEPGLAMVASALLPGAGQFLLGSDRWVPYLAVDIWAWVSFIDSRGDARSLARDYRDLAWFVARRVSVGERRDTIFEYYEEMTHYAASGTWDSDPGQDGVQPELDPRTFNGDLWALSRQLFFPGGVPFQPGSQPYEQALAYYTRNAIPPSFTWAWGDSFLEQQSFRELIRTSDEAYRTSTQFLGLILANHLVSAVDALVTGRLAAGSSEARLRIRSGFEPGPSRIARLRIEASWRW